MTTRTRTKLDPSSSPSPRSIALIATVGPASRRALRAARSQQTTEELDSS